MSDLSWMRPKLAELCGVPLADEAGVYIVRDGTGIGPEWRPDEDVAQAVRCLDAQPYDWCIDPRWVEISVPQPQDDGPMYFEPQLYKSDVCVSDEPLERWIARNACLAIAAALGWEKAAISHSRIRNAGGGGDMKRLCDLGLSNRLENLLIEDGFEPDMLLDEFVRVFDADCFRRRSFVGSRSMRELIDALEDEGFLYRSGFAKKVST